MVPVQMGDEDVVDLVERHFGGEIIRDRAGSEIEDEVSARCQARRRSDVPIWPGLGSGELPMKVTRISSGCTCSVPGVQLAALFSHGIGEMPSNMRPSFHRPIGWPAVAISFRNLGISLEALLLERLQLLSGQRRSATLGEHRRNPDRSRPSRSVVFRRVFARLLVQEPKIVPAMLGMRVLPRKFRAARLRQRELGEERQSG